MFKRRLQTISIILFLAIASVAALLWLMGSLAGSQNAPTGAPSEPAQAAQNLAQASQPLDPDEVVATVNGQAINRQAWQQATRLDAAMSQLAAQPIPTAEETLDRLINEIIVLNAAFPLTQGQGGKPPAAAEVEARLQALETAWQVNDDAVVTALAKAGLERADLVERVSRLIQVEAALKQISSQQADLNVWLAQARASAEIGLYRALVDSAAPQAPAATPTAVAGQEPPPATPPAALATAPYPQNMAPDFSLNQLNGVPLALSALKGKPVLINFWATWCPPCRSELPALQAAFQKYQDKVAFIAVDLKEDPATVSAMVKELGLTFPIALDTDGQVSNGLYEVRGIPTSIFVDASGVVSARHIGPLDQTLIDNYLVGLLLPGSSTTLSSGPAEGVPSSPTLPPSPHPAPEFTLAASDGSTVSLADYKGKSSVVLVFYRGYT